MNNFEKNITFVIVSYKSSHIIEKCIKSINSNIKIIVVENWSTRSNHRENLAIGSADFLSCHEVDYERNRSTPN